MACRGHHRNAVPVTTAILLQACHGSPPPSADVASASPGASGAAIGPPSRNETKDEAGAGEPKVGLKGASHAVRVATSQTQSRVTQMLAMTGKQADVATMRGLANGRTLHTKFLFKAATSTVEGGGEIAVKSSVYVGTTRPAKQMGNVEPESQLFLSERPAILTQDALTHVFGQATSAPNPQPIAVQAEAPLRNEEAFVLEIVPEDKAADADLSLEVARQLGQLKDELREALKATTVPAVSKKSAEEEETQPLRMLNIAAQARATLPPLPSALMPLCCVPSALWPRGRIVLGATVVACCWASEVSLLAHCAIRRDASAEFELCAPCMA